MTVGYKSAGNENVQFHVWQTGAGKDWSLILDNATPQQLATLGIPAPGTSYWTARTLKLTQARWPNWDMTPYFEAAGIKH